MKEGYVIRNQTLPHFITPTVVDWIDIFTRQTYRDIIIDCLDYCIKNKGMAFRSECFKMQKKKRKVGFESFRDCAATLGENFEERGQRNFAARSNLSNTV